MNTADIWCVTLEDALFLGGSRAAALTTVHTHVYKTPVGVGFGTFRMS